MKPSLNGREKATRIILGVLVVLAALLVPTRCTVGSRESYTAEADSARQEATRLRTAAERAQVETDKPGFEQRLDRLRAAVPDTDDLAGVIAEVSAAATASGMTLTSGSPTPAEQDGTTKQWSLSLSVQGPPESLPRFLDALSGLERLVVTDGVTAQVGAIDGTTQVVATVNTRFFAAPPQGSGG